MKITIYFILSLFFLSSCSNYVNKIHRELDRADGKRRKPRPQRDQFDFYRNQPTSPSRVSTGQKKVLLPVVKRSYQPQKRVKADDLNDNGNPGSLWVGSGDDNFLFTNDSNKTNGDIVLIDVESRLKNEITAELKRAFPDRKRKVSAAGKEKKEGAPEAQAAAAPPAAGAEKDANAGPKDEVFDRISSIVIEEINKDHLLLRGRKFLLYKNRKRLVEIQALVPRREITNADTVSSSSIIESSVNVIR